MKKINLFLALIATANCSFAQMDIPPSGGNPRATVTEEVGITSITIKYSRPDVNKREGKIWGDLLTDLPQQTSLQIKTHNPGGPEPMKIPPSCLSIM